MSKLAKLRSKLNTHTFNEADINRDAEGKFAPKDAAKQIASKTKRKKKVSDKDKDFDALVEEIFQERFKRYKENGSYKHIMLGDGKKYGDIVESLGKDAAEKAYKAHMRKTAVAIATEISDKVKTERETIAFERLYPHLKYTSTLKDFKDKNPNVNLLSRLDTEEKLDKILSHDSIMKRGSKYTANLDNKMLRAKTIEEKLTIMEKHREELIKTGMTLHDAKNLVSSKNIDSSIKGIDRGNTSKWATEFYQITNGAGSTTLDTFKYTDKRAYASEGMRDINIGEDGFAKDIYHEMGHHIEYEDKRIAKAASDWRDKRATGSASPLRGYSNEIAIPGNYVSPYVGKIYHNGCTEVISVGLEAFSSSEKMLRFYEKDKEHFQFIMGVIKRD